MLTRKKSIKSRTRRARRKQNKFVTPDLVLSGGKLMRFVAGPDDPLREAERLRGEFAQLVADHDAEVGQFLQLPILSRSQFRWRLGDFKRLQVHPFWKQTGHEAAGPVDLEVGPLLDHASDHAGHGQSRRPVCRDPGRIEAGAGGGRRSRRPHPRAGRDRAAYEALRVHKRGDAQVTSTVAVAETAPAGRRTRRPDEVRLASLGHPCCRPNVLAGDGPRLNFPTYPLVSPICSPKRRSSHPTH